VAEGAGIGKLAAVVSPPDSRLQAPCDIRYTTMTDGNRAGRWLKYTAFGDVEETSECADGDTFVTGFHYDDPFGRQSAVTYPEIGGQRLSVGYNYTQFGYLHYVTDLADGSVYWAATAMNALGQVTDQYTRNGVQTQSFTNPATGWLLGTISTAHADGDAVVANWGNVYDEGGNLLRRVRADQVVALSDESFAYDLLERVTTSTLVTSGYNRTELYDFDSLGNLIAKNGTRYGYGDGCSAGARAAGPHAVCTVNDSAAYSYDGNGNMLSGGGRTVTYDLYNKAVHIERAGAQAGAADFVYGAEGNRVVQVATGADGTARTVYVGLGATGKSLYERTTRGGAVEHVQFVYAGSAHGGSAFALRVVASSGSPSATKYYHYDHLGSVVAMSDDLGRVAGGGADATVLGYDPWGLRRQPDGRPAAAPLHTQVGRREFTGHEAIAAVGLVNMNGRIYDPTIGRFLTPDPNVQFVANLQSYNRYSYVLNNPLRYTDPTGYFLGMDVGQWAFAIAETVIVAGACYEGGPAVCALAVMWVAAMNTAVAVAQGAPWDQTLEITAVGLAIGLATGGAATGVGAGFMGSLVAGAAAAAATTAISNAITGRPLGENVFQSIAISAVMASVSYGLTEGMKQVSKASAAQARGGGGSGESRVESHVWRTVAAYRHDELDDILAAGLAAYDADGPDGPITPLTPKGCILTGAGCNLRVAPNLLADGSVPIYELRHSPITGYSSMIDAAATRAGVDPDLLRAVLYVETTHGYYDAPLDVIGINKSIRPSNINVDFWGDAFGTRSQLHGLQANIQAGANLLGLIQFNVAQGSSIDEIATLYNNVNAVQVSNYGARVSQVYYSRLWAEP